MPGPSSVRCISTRKPERVRPLSTARPLLGPFSLTGSSSNGNVRDGRVAAFSWAAARAGSSMASCLLDGSTISPSGLSLLSFQRSRPAHGILLAMVRFLLLLASVTALAAEDPQGRELLALHNDLRAKVGAPALTWSDKLASVAGEWAKTLVARGQFQHSKN